jgi:hypothetical protein
MLGLNVNNMLDHAAIVSLQQEYDLQGKGQSQIYTTRTFGFLIKPLGDILL